MARMSAIEERMAEGGGAVGSATQQSPKAQPATNTTIAAVLAKVCASMHGSAPMVYCWPLGAPALVCPMSPRFSLCICACHPCHHPTQVGPGLQSAVHDAELATQVANEALEVVATLKTSLARITGKVGVGGLVWPGGGHRMGGSRVLGPGGIS